MYTLIKIQTTSTQEVLLDLTKEEYHLKESEITI